MCASQNERCDPLYSQVSRLTDRGSGSQPSVLRRSSCTPWPTTCVKQARGMNATLQRPVKGLQQQGSSHGTRLVVHCSQICGMASIRLRSSSWTGSSYLKPYTSHVRAYPPRKPGPCIAIVCGMKTDVVAGVQAYGSVECCITIPPHPFSMM